MRTTLPDICNQNLLVGFVIRSMTKLIPKPVIKAYIISLKAAPMPVTKPYQRPFFKVRCIQRIPTGPIGAEAMIPMIIPFRINSNKSIFIGIGIIQPAKLLVLFEKWVRKPHFFVFLRPNGLIERWINPIQ